MRAGREPPPDMRAGREPPPDMRAGREPDPYVWGGRMPSANVNYPKGGYGADPRDRFPNTASEAGFYQRFSVRKDGSSPFPQQREREFSSQRNWTDRKRPSPVSDEELSGVKISRQEGHTTFGEQRCPLSPQVLSKGCDAHGDSTNFISPSSSFCEQSPLQEEQSRTRRQKQPTDFLSLSSPSRGQPQVQEQSVEEFSLAQLRKDLLRVISCFPEGIPITKLRKKYQELLGRKLKLKDYRLKSVNELFTVIEDDVDVDCHGDDGDDVFLKCKRKPDERSCASADGLPGSGHCHASAADWSKTQTELVKDFKMEDVRQTVLDLFFLHPDGFPVKQLASIFSQRYRRNLTVSHYGFKSVQNFVESMCDVICIENGIMRPISRQSGVREDAPQGRIISLPSPAHQQMGTKGNSEVPSVQFGSPNQLNSNAWGVSGNVTPVHPNPRGPVAPSFISFDTPSSANLSKDFPELGTKLTKWEEMRLKEQMALERHSSSLKNDYYAQIREVHSSNMQELDTLNRNDSSAVNQKLSVTKVNQLAEDFIRAISAEHELVTVEKVCLSEKKIGTVILISVFLSFFLGIVYYELKCQFG
ncbi:uncharacterized protein LOC122800224 [Protopterus annectens]|uniref:uncharacterized protein LOC122800224 n=1 Tax=Protopterus annectens TaxID=7888 RepID=UPI001CFB96F9|nr:uncharacterized protein LOC122800224 [Protopterus annectens]